MCTRHGSEVNVEEDRMITVRCMEADKRNTDRNGNMGD